MSTSVKISVDLSSKSVDSTLYIRMSSSLLYLIASIPDIAFNLGVCAYFQANPKESHLTTVKHIIRYVNDTINHGLWYSKETNLVLTNILMQIGLVMLMIEKAHRGDAFIVGTNLVAWLSRKHPSVSLSTTKAEYIAIGSYCTQLLWMKKLQSDYGFTQYSRTKHIDIRHHLASSVILLSPGSFSFFYG